MENELYHHGIKGQRWGIRRYQNKDGSLTPAGKKRVAKLESEYSRLTGKKTDGLSNNTHGSSSSSKIKNISEMSNEEIQDRIDRIRLENNYRTVMKESISNISNKETSKGRQFVNEVVTNAGKNIATQTTVWAMGTVVNKAIESITGEKNAINPKKGQKDK